ncbi:MAG: hypothetical protein LBE57_00200 [Methanosarcinales archaeon]|jgi:hypothetical protein|nr:hypothetical protein [Methanosarcinales archaeon]
MEQKSDPTNENKPIIEAGLDFEANRGVYSTLRDYSSGGFKEFIYDFFNIPYQKKK